MHDLLSSSSLQKLALATPTRHPLSIANCRARLSVARDAYCMGTIHDVSGRPDQAMICYKRALAIHLKTFGKFHPLVR